MLILYIVLAAIFVLLSAFFSSSETAFISLQRAKLQHQVNTNVKGADRVLKIMKKPEKLLSTVILGNNLVQNAAVALLTAVAVNLVQNYDQAIIIATIGSTIIIIIFGESTPKAIGARHAQSLSRFYARPIEWISWLFSPFVFVLSWISVFVTRMTGQKSVPHSLASEDEIRAMITVGEDEGEVEEAEAEMLHNVFDFTDRPVGEVMVPRPDVVFIESVVTIKDFLAIYAQSPLSRYPVFGENRDDVLGILSIKDVLMALAKGDVINDSLIKALVRPAYFAPVTKPIGELFREMRDNNFHLCVAVDEFGGTAGIVTINQLVEEIVGPVGDELTPREKDFEVIDTHTFEIDGSMHIEEINEEMRLELPEGEYQTIAGFILSLLGRIPKVNEQLKYKDLKLVIKEMQGLKIGKILLTKESHATSKD
jgi:putative hemolysin